MKRTITFAARLIPYAFVLLFIYAAVSKLMDFENFRVQLAQSPMLSAYAGVVSYGVIALELVISMLLLVPKTRKAALYASFGLMVAFTVYIYLILKYSDFVPCSCGGILEKMGWKEHLVFNIIMVGLACTALFYAETKRATLKTTAYLLTGAAISSAVMVALFLSSEYIIKKENNFTRRFPHHPVIEDKRYDLGVNSYYFAGISGDQIFLGNSTTPFTLRTIDKNLLSTAEIKLHPDSLHIYHAVKSVVTKHYLYMYDGSVPVIYRSRPDDFSGKIFQLSNKEVYFDQLINIDPNRFIFRTTSRNTGSLVLGQLDLNAYKKVQLNSHILQRQSDGIFDVDGHLEYDRHKEQVAYVYNYRNQVVLSDSILGSVRILKTIDTVQRADIIITQMHDGSRIMAKPPLTINRNSTMYNGFLFIHSTNMGRFESRSSWDKSDVVDVYQTDTLQYWGSFYVQRRGGKRMSQMLVTDPYLFVLAGHYITRYRIAQTLVRNLK
ncbi:hypothetical protein HER18_05300 [Chryseobacterium sp. NEB161]|nr:hypothetical protein HER18_05300 [Chryseobacterium sp. NEB161]